MANVIIVPGNGNTGISENWFPYVKARIEKLGIAVQASNMPDPNLARAKYWLPFIRNELKAGKDSVLIGHSSGAVAILRYLEQHQAAGAILVGACYTDLGSAHEAASGYYSKPWRWAKIKAHAGWLVQFASTDDPYIPITEARHIHEQLGTEYREYTDQGHFGADCHKTEFPEIVEIVKQKLKL